MTDQIVFPLNDLRANLETVGGKGASLARLLDAKFPVPEGFHVTTEAYRIFVAENELQPQIDSALQRVNTNVPSTLEEAAASIHRAFMHATIPKDIASTIVGAYGDLHGTDPAVAVRSSATAEDLPDASFAGQQESFLNVSGAENVLDAVRKCWSSLWTARAIGYRLRQGVSDQGVALAVVVQVLVPAEVAGILFTVNPLDGNHEHALISASWGLGDAVVGGRVTPDEYVVKKANGAIVRQQVADKEVMTVRTNGATEDQPVSDSLRNVPVLQKADVRELNRLGVEIENLYEMPMDVEWALADGKVYIVQARPITSLPEPESPIEWPIPDPKGRYLRASIVDLMPDPLSPLFGTLGISIYNEMIVQMMVDLADAKAESLPEQLIITINDYAYMCGGYTARQWWEMLSKLAPKLPKLIREGPDHFREVALPEYESAVSKLAVKDVNELTAEELWADAHELVRIAIYHLSVLQVDTLGAAAGSEGLFTGLYNRFYRRDEDPTAPVFLMGYDTMPIRLEKSIYKLADMAKEQPDLSSYLLTTPTAEIVASLRMSHAPEGLNMEAWKDWVDQFEIHINTFGHMLYDIDFSKPIPAEDPTPMLEAIKMYLRGEGSNPYDRQKKLELEREQAIENLQNRARGLRGWAVWKALGWAQSLAQVREDSVASLGVGYPRLRKVLLELGRRLVEAGGLKTLDDIFWLYENEIEDTLGALQAGERIPSKDAEVEVRKARIEAEKKLVPPSQIPESNTYFGIPVDVFVPHEGGTETGKLIGVGASAGQVTGTACVLHGPEDFDRMQEGGILVAKMTTPAWTPLFAMAAGIVTDIGGPLSHGSIVAREYGIPAVLGTGYATRLIQSGQVITVDGEAGFVLLQSQN